MNYTGVIFDLDGTLIDSEPIFNAVAKQAAQDFGRTFTDELYISLLGLPAKLQDLAPTRVRARVLHASPQLEEVVLRGRTENKRTVAVKAEVAGRIVERPVERGTPVAVGDLLCRIAMDDRMAGLNEAREKLNQAEIEYAGSLRLKERGFQSETAIAQAKARRAAAIRSASRSSTTWSRARFRARSFRSIRAPTRSTP